MQPVNPKKAAAIKVEVDKLLNFGFIYLVPLTKWVYNPVPVENKGNILVCTDFHDLNKTCPKDNSYTLFINQIINECVGNEISSLPSEAQAP